MGSFEIMDTYLESGEITRRLLVKIVNFAVVNDEERFMASLEPDRDKERARVIKDLRQMRKLVRKSQDECFSEFFINTYPYAMEGCGGCPACHSQGNELTYYRPKLIIPFNNQQIEVTADLTGSLEELSAGFQEIILKPAENDWNQETLLHLIDQLTVCNISTVVLPEGNEIDLTEMVKEAPTGVESINYTFLTEEELNSFPLELLKGSVAIFYQQNDHAQMISLFRWSRQFLEMHPYGKIIHVTVPDIFIPSEGKTIDSLIDYISIDHAEFLERQDKMFSLEMF